MHPRSLAVLILLFGASAAHAADTLPPTVAITAPASGATVSGTITISASASDNQGVAGVQFKYNGINIGAEETAAPYSIAADTTAVADGSYVLTAVARDAAGNQATSAPVTVVVANGPRPYAGTAVALPGTFEAENFDLGGEGVAYRDNTAGNQGGQYRLNDDVDIILSSDSIGGSYVVNNFEAGEWLGYTVNVAATGIYAISLRASSTSSTSAFHVEIDGKNVTGSIVAPNTGSWSSFQWVSNWIAVPISAGTHFLKVVVDQPYFNLNSITVAVATDQTPPAVTITAPAPGATVSGTITISANASDNVGVAGVQFMYNGANLGAEVTTAPYSVVADTTTVPDGSYILTAVARDAAGNSTTSAPVTIAVANASRPYTGTPIAVPGTFEAENFDLGGESVAYHDTTPGNQGGQYRLNEDVDLFVSNDPLGGGYIVKNFEAGEWLAYTISVPASGSYDIQLRAVTNAAFPNSAYHAEVDGVNVTGTVVLPTTDTVGWSSFQWIGKATLSLAAGTHSLKIFSEQPYFALNQIQLSATPTPDPSAVAFFCTFPLSPADCGFGEQSAVPGRATIASLGRDGLTSVRLHTEPGDSNVAGSGVNERDDLSISQQASDCYEGREQWWAHSILFPDDYVDPPTSTDTTWNWAVVFDFHNSSPGAGQANFQINAWPVSALYSDRPTGLGLQIAYGDQANPTVQRFPLGPIVRDTWYDFVYHVKWTSAADGYFTAWLNGAKVMDYQGPTLYAGQGCYLKLANYHTPFGQPSSVIHDRVIRGSTAAAVALTPLEGVLP
jgi:Polysaccharide lyase/Bacterial Ig domain/Carbohydrate binding module (family 6)